MMRRLLLLLVTALIARGLLPAVALAQDAPQRVTMTLEAFLAMRDKAENRDHPLVPPRNASVASLVFDGEVALDDDGEPTSAVFDLVAQVVVHVDRGLVRVPLLAGDVALLSATMAGRPAPVALEGDAYTALLGPGAHELKLRVAVGVVPDGSQPVFRLRLPPAGVVTARVFLPGDRWSFTAPGAQIVERTTARDGARIRLTLPASSALVLAWSRAVDEDAQLEVARVDATVHTLVQVGEGLVRAHAYIDHIVRFQGIDTLRFTVPEGYAVLDVTAIGPSRWQVDGRELSIALGRETLGAVRVDVDLERVLGHDGQVVAPLLVPVGAERVKGFVGVTADGTLEVAAADVIDANAVDVRVLPAGLLTLTNQPLLLGFKYLDAGATVGLSVTEHDDVAVLVTLLDQANAVSMFTIDGRRITSVTWSVRNNRRQFLRVTMPPGSELWSAAVAGRSVQPARSAGGDVLVPLVRSSDRGGSVSAFGVELVYVETMQAPDASGSGTFEASLPRVDVPTTYVAWTVFAPDQARLDLRHTRGNVRNVVNLSRPLGELATMTVPADRGNAQQAANATAASGGLGEGTEPVRVSLPLEGRRVFFEKLLALDETLQIAFDYRGLK